MQIIILGIGILIGILLSFLVLVFGRAKQAKIERFLNVLEGKSHEQAEFFDPGSTELDALEDLYEANKAKGIDTPI